VVARRWIALVLMLALTAVWAGCEAPPIFHEDFNGVPQDTGWESVALPREEKDCGWEVGPELPRGPFIVVRSGGWLGPLIPVASLEYYRLRFSAQLDGRGYWAAQCHDKDGKVMNSDHYSCVYGTGQWSQEGSCFRARAGAAHVRLLFRAQKGVSLRVDDVTLTPVSRKQVARWANAVYATVPPLSYIPAADRWQHMERTMAKLRQGGPVTIVLLGDSIANDTSNSTFDVLLQRRYRKAQVRLIASVRGGTGCGYYRRGGRVNSYVLAHKPDLLIIAGISHGYEVEPIRDVIRQVRAESDPDILVMTGPVTPDKVRHEDFLMYRRMPREEAAEKFRSFPGRMAQMAQEEEVEFFDMKRVYEDYVAQSGRPAEWFMRDRVHANTRGKQVLARILDRYFAPKKVRWDD